MDPFSLIIGIAIGFVLPLVVVILPAARGIIRKHRAAEEEIHQRHAELRARIEAGCRKYPDPGGRNR